MRTAVVLLVALGLAAAFGSARAEVPPDRTLFMGTGMSSWRIGTRFRLDDDLVRSERYPRKDGGGCIAGPATASRIDFYPGIRLSWSFYDGKTFLHEVASTRPGDRSAVGFVIGESRLRHVRARYRSAQLYRNQRGRYKLGSIELVVYRRTGYESGKYMDYWFNRQGLLVGLATGVSGC